MLLRQAVRPEQIDGIGEAALLHPDSECAGFWIDVTRCGNAVAEQQRGLFIGLAFGQAGIECVLQAASSSTPSNGRMRWAAPRIIAS